jgi:hypothetical protein
LGLRSATQPADMLDRRDARVHKHLLEFLKKIGGSARLV